MIYKIGSTTKTFTAAAILRLDQEGEDKRAAVGTAIGFSSSSAAFW
jgi:hypothetical protein